MKTNRMNSGITWGVLALCTFSMAAQPFNRAYAAGEAVKTSSAGKAGAGGMSEDELKAMGQIETPFAACKDMTLVDSDAYKKNEAKWKSAQSSAGFKAPMRVVPSNSVFSKFDGKVAGVTATAGALGANQFLYNVGEKAMVGLEKGIADLKKFKAECFGSSPAANCADRVAKFVKPVAEKQDDFRIALGKMREPEPQKELRGLLENDPTVYMNLAASPVDAGVSGPKSSGPLSGNELATVKKEVTEEYEKLKAAYRKEVDETIAKRGLTGQAAADERKRLMDLKNVQSYMHSRMLAFKAKAQTDYFALLTKAPQLAYIDAKTAKAAKPDLSKQLAEMIEDSEEQLKETKKVLAGHLDWKKGDTFNNDLLRFGQYTAVIEEMLAKEATVKANGGKPANCAIATATFNEVASAKMANGLIAAAGLISAPFGVGLLAPKIVGLATAGKVAMSATAAGNLALGMGIIGGLGMSASDIGETLDTQQMVRAGLMKADDAKDAFTTGMMSAPMAVFDLGGAKAVIGAAAGVAARALVTRGRTVAAASKVSENQLSKLVQAAHKGDSKAMTELTNHAKGDLKSLIGRMPTVEDDAMVESMVKKGLMGANAQSDADVLKALGRVTADLSAKEQKEVLAAAQDLTNAVGTDAAAKATKEATTAKAVVTEGTAAPAEIAAAIPAMARAGVPAEQAKSMASWPKEGLQGAANVAESIAKKTKGKLVAAKDRAEAFFDVLAEKWGVARNKWSKAQKEQGGQMCICMLGKRQCSTAIAFQEIEASTTLTASCVFP